MSEIEIERAQRVPGWLMGIIAALLVGAITAGAAAVLDTRTSQARLEERVTELERDRTSLATVPVALATMSAQISTLQTEVASLRNDLKGRK